MATEPRAKPALTAAAMSRHYRYDLQLAASVVLVFDAGLIPARSATRSQRRATHPFRDVGSLATGVDVVLAAGPGAPVAAITVEFLAALGARRIIAVGTAGALAASQGALGAQPTPIVIERAESDEGTSTHFGNDLNADAELTDALVEAVGGQPHVALTTDVPFRHTPERLARHRDRADVVEMECAALFATARHFNLQCGAALVVSDQFTPEGAWLPLDPEQVTAALRANVQVAAQVLSRYQ